MTRFDRAIDCLHDRLIDRPMRLLTWPIVAFSLWLLLDMADQVVRLWNEVGR